MTHRLKIQVAPVNDLVTTDDAIQYFKIPDLVAPEERNLIDLCVAAAFEIAEMSTNLTIRTTTFRLYLDSFPCRTIELPRPPLKTTEGLVVHYLKADDTEADVDADVYQVDAVSVPARLGLKYQQYWPVDVRLGTMNAVYIEYVSGFVDKKAIPETLLWAILNLAQHFYDTRNPVVVAAGGLQAIEVPKTFEWAFRMFRIWDFHDYITGK